MVILDTDLIITYLRHVPRTPTKEFLTRKQKAVEIIDHFSGKENNDIILRTTIFNVGELHVGLNRDPNKANASKILSGFLKRVTILSFSIEDSIRFGEIKANLFDKAKICGDIDILIASVVLNHDETLYTNNIAHYNNIPGLSLKDWMLFNADATA
jgi:predicted nucleic acid-binding protein